MRNHPLRSICQELGVPFVNMNGTANTMIDEGGLNLEVSCMAFDYDFIISLPVLKSHSICSLTGALKNGIGYLTRAEKSRLHWRRDVHQVIVVLNRFIKPHLHIVDAVETMVNTNEVRHGGRPRELGYMLAGLDSLSLDVLGLELLRQVEPRLKDKQWRDIKHLSYADDAGIGEVGYEVAEL